MFTHFSSVPVRILMALSATLALSTPLVSSPISLVPKVQDIDVQWKGKMLSLEQLKAKAPSPLALTEQLERYQDWVLENDYHVALSADGRVILVTQSPKASKSRMKLVEDSLLVFDKLMLPPHREGSQETFLTAGWGVGQHRPDSQPVVLIEVQKSAQYHSLCSDLGSMNQRLENWAQTVTDEPGFAQEEVAAAAWQSAPIGYELGEVWRPENELVNSLARLLLHRSYGPQPTWLRLATSWRIEMEVLDGLYCFPYRKAFIAIDAHDGWEKVLKREFGKRKKTPLAHAEFANWKRNTWDDAHARLSWGFVEFLARHKPEVLPAVAEEFRLLYKDGSVITSDNINWTSNPNYQIPVDEQLTVLTGQGGENLFAEASSFLRSWKRYKPKK
jgi:hypothetical protein